MQSVGTPWLWAVFTLVVVAMLAIDLFVAGRGERRMSVRTAALWSGVWVSVAAVFAAGLWWTLDASAGRTVANETTLAFVTGYLIEKSLAIDNVFVWLMLFSFFAIPLALQKRVLVYGVVGAIVMRTVMIFAGVWLIAKFHWMLYVFGAFLAITGVKMWLMAEKKPDLANNPVIGFLKRRLRVTESLHGERFFITREEGGRLVRVATPLFLVLVLVELTDLIFAVDSIPAIFAITTDPFIVLTSNVFALLGLRAMYFLLADMADRFALLKYGLAAVLVFVGAKMMLIDLVKIPVPLSLGIVATFIGVSVVLSLRRAPRAAGSPAA